MCNAYNFYLWGNMKQKVYRNYQRTLKVLHIKIQDVIQEIMKTNFSMSQNLFHQCEICLDVGQHHF
jgi:hypothetical protein